MNAFKIIGIVLLAIIFVFCFLFTLYFLFAANRYGIETLGDLFQDGFFAGIKNFFVDIWEGIKYKA